MLSKLFTNKIIFLILTFQIINCTSQYHQAYQEKLYFAICSLNVENVKMYLKFGADPNYLLSGNDTYLHLTASLYLESEMSDSHIKICRLLIKYGAKNYLKNINNQIAFDIAQIHGYEELFDLLRF